ncbi:MAG: YkgJ family cysteine cluster protein [Thermoplasmata archaeon]|nr:YkgJ family cysteine cluster protein [Thermoplasmata archaeon]
MVLVPDLRLVGGFRFRCLPGCGLCCFTTPAVAPSERPRLIQIDPEVPLVEGSGGWATIASRPEGGACHFLQDQRCGCHAARPSTCAEFPLTVHVSERVQVAVVLTCPGVDLSGLAHWADGTYRQDLHNSLTSELEAVALEIARAEAGGELRSANAQRRKVERRLASTGRWQSEEQVRRLLRGRTSILIPSDIDAGAYPDAEDELEALPMFFEPTKGRVAWRAHPAGVEFLTLRESGGIESHLEVLDPPRRPPELLSSAKASLAGYLHYVLERDSTIGVAYYRLLGGAPGLPSELVAQDLRFVAGQVLRMATLRRALVSGRRGALTASDIENGIRATDMDILDRPTVGLRL